MYWRVGVNDPQFPGLEFYSFFEIIRTNDPGVYSYSPKTKKLDVAIRQRVIISTVAMHNETEFAKWYKENKRL